MNIARRQFLHMTAATATLPLLTHPAAAQTYPDRPVHLVVGFPAGSPADTMARFTAQSLSGRLGQQVIIENRPGAAGNIGAETVVKAPADGYTLLLITAAYTTNASLYRNLNYKFVRDIAPVAGISRGSFAMVVSPSFPAKTVPEFIAYAKANPGKINMASSGIGSPPHIFGSLFEMMTGVKLVHVPYAGNYLPDVLGGRVQVAFTPIPLSIGQIRAGKLRVLAITGTQRLTALPDVPAMAEFVAGYEADGWVGVGAPKNTPSEVINKLNTEINSLVAEPKFKARLKDLGNVPMRMTPAEFGKFIVNETNKWAKVIEFAGIKPM